MLFPLGEWCNPNCIYVLAGELAMWAVIACVVFGVIFCKRS
jgi:predicted membrane protein